MYDKAKNFPARCNMEMIEFDVLDEDDNKELKTMVENHLKYTDSDVAKDILSNWDAAVKDFVKVMPSDYKAVLLKRKNQGNKEAVING